MKTGRMKIMSTFTGENHAGKRRGTTRKVPWRHRVRKTLYRKT